MKLVLLLATLQMALTACQTAQTVISNETDPPVLDAKKWKKDCQTSKAVPGAKWCYWETGASPTGQPIWYMHGLGDSEQWPLSPSPLSSTYAPLEVALSKTPTQMVTVSWGASWVLTAYSGRTQDPTSATVDNMVSKLMPEIVAAHPMKPPYRLFGHSMGGANAAMLLTIHPELWSKAILWNAMLLTDKTQPFSNSTAGDILSCPACLEVIVPATGAGNYSTEAQWESDRPSAHLALATSLPKTLMLGCKTDTYQLYPGELEFATQAKAKGFDVTFTDDGSPCAHYDGSVSMMTGFLGN